MRNIAFFCSVTSLNTGMPLCTLTLIEHFSADPGYRVHVIFPEYGAMTEKLRNKNVALRKISFEKLRSPDHFGSLLRFVFLYPGAMIRLWRYLRANKIDLVHFSDFIDFPFYPAGRIGAKRVVAHLRLNIENAWLRRLYKAWCGICVDAVVCISRSVKRYSGLPDRAARVVYDPGPDVALFDPSRVHERDSRLRPGVLHIVAIAKFLNVKGHHHFIDIAHRIEQRCPGRAQYIVTGGSEPGHEDYYRSCVEQIARSGLTDAFTILGIIPHESIPALLANTDIFVHVPDYQEGLGGVILEAMSMEKPVVAFDSGGAGECFEDGTSGFLVQQYDCAAAAEKIVRLIEDGPLRQAVGKSAARHVAAHFSQQRHCAEIESVYNALSRPWAC